MNYKLITLFLLTIFLVGALSNVSAKTQTITTDVRVGDAISIHHPDEKTCNKGVYINEVCIWSVLKQCSINWSGGWLDKLLVDLKDQGFVEGFRFAKKGHFEQEYKWHSGLFSQNSQKTVFIFNIK